MYLVFLILFVLVRAEYFNIDPFEQSLYVTGGYKSDNHKLLELEQAMETGQILAKLQHDQNEWLPTQGIYMSRNSSGFFRFNTGPQPPELSRRYQSSSVILKGLQVYLRNLNSEENPKNKIKNLYKHHFVIHGICKNISNKTCSKTSIKYRNFDGSCNNLKHPFWGASQSTFIRLLDPDYEDGIYKPRLSRSGDQLPSAREITLKVFGSKLTPDNKLTLLASEMGQLIAHDTQQALPDNIENGPIQCCTEDGQELPAALSHSSCMPILVPKNDPVFGKFNRQCMNFIRSVTAPRRDCVIGPPEQINMVTSFLDCSFVYGNSKKMSDTLRTFKNGKLKESSPKKFRMLPLTDSIYCDYRRKEEACYIAGDSRVNQNPHLVAMHVTFLREHNRIAEELLTLNHHWEDEKLFQETRRILIAIYQHIVYKEYLPLFIGKKFIKKLFAEADKNGFTNNYDQNLNPTSINSMNIVFRCYHSTLPDKIKLCNETGQVKSEHKFSDCLIRPILCCNNHDEILNSLCCSPMMKMSDCVTPEITDKLFKSTSKYGLDLIAMDIQRERDHGIPGYNKFRDLCGLKKASNFKDLAVDMEEEKIKKLRKVYKDVDDIDLIVGSQLENHVPGTQFGPVILYIIREQFYRYMKGDRFFYTNINQNYPFTAEQLKEIQKMSIARIICDNGNNIRSIQSRAFEKETERNVKMLCENIPKIDLRPWKQKIK